MSPRRVGGAMEPSDPFHSLLREANIDEGDTAPRESVVSLEDTLPPQPGGTEAEEVHDPYDDGYMTEEEEYADESAGTEAGEIFSAETEAHGEPEMYAGYEEFAEVPTGGYLQPDTDEKEPQLLLGSEVYAGGRRSRKSRAQQHTGTLPKVPLRQVRQEEVRDIGGEDDRRSRSVRRGSRTVAWVFCLFLGIFALLFIFLPKSYFSGVERSVLAAEPTLSPKTLFDGSFEEKAETYVSDHFPLRSGWIGLNSYYNLVSGRTLINGVYVGRDNYIIEEPTEVDSTSLDANLQAVRTFLKERQYPASFIAVPSAGYILDDKLPAVHLPYHDLEILTHAKMQLEDTADWIEISPDLTAEAAVEQVYYRTDHHWTTLGAYIAYLRWAQVNNKVPLPPDQFRISYYGGFRGSTYAKVLLWNTPADMIALWQRDGHYSVEMSDAGETAEVTDSFYDMEALTSYDPYMVFFGGNHGLVHITNADTDAEGTLLLVKDSFANSFIPFIAPHYKEIFVVDPRYYKDLRTLCDTNTIDAALFVYSTHNLVADQDLGLIDM